MTMIVRISGDHGSSLEAPMIIFTNRNSDYPIRRLEDFVLGVSYHTGPKGWIDQSIFSQYFMEPRAYQLDHHGRIKYVWVDNCTAHNMTPTLAAVLIQKQTTLKYLPICVTHLCQPAYTFLISNIKEVWTKRWEAKKSELIQENA